MKVSEFRKLIREEVRRVVAEAKVGDPNAKPFKDARTGKNDSKRRRLRFQEQKIITKGLQT